MFMRYHKNKFIYSGLVILALLAVGVLLIIQLTPRLDTDRVNKVISRIDQNPTHYLAGNSHQPLADPDERQHQLLQYCRYYFSPWHDDNILFHTDDITKTFKQNAQKFLTSNKIWGDNLRPWAQQKKQQLVQNMDLGHFPNSDQRGIIVHDTEVRVMPTSMPKFSNPFQAGEGYPFDYAQSGHVSTGKPLKIIHVSQDGQWYCVKFAGYYGWVPSQDVAFVDSNFVQQWQSGDFSVSLRDDTPIRQGQSVIDKTRLGMIYPRVSEFRPANEIYTVGRDSDGWARMVKAHGAQQVFRPFPLPYTAENVARLAETLQNNYYGWGSIRGARDCSATTRDLISAFGIWVPRNSSMQAGFGDKIDLKGLTRHEKLNVIKEKAVPFATLIDLHGHVMLYIGTFNGKVYAFHNTWSFKTDNLFGQGRRALIGRTVITPLSLDLNFANVQKPLIDKTYAITLL